MAFTVIESRVEGKYGDAFRCEDALVVTPDFAAVIDGATSAERQRYMFDRIYKVLAGSFSLPDKDTARSYFLNLRQMFMDLNYLAMDSREFKDQEAAIEAKIAERSTVNA